MVNHEGEVCYIDFFDSCYYNQYSSGIISGLLGSYMQYYRMQESIDASENMDRLSFLLSFYDFMYMRALEKTSNWRYHKLSDHITTLQNAEYYRNILLDKSCMIPEIPYVHEFIDENDDYVINCFTQAPLLQKVKYLVNARKK